MLEKEEEKKKNYSTKNDIIDINSGKYLKHEPFAYNHKLPPNIVDQKGTS